MTSNWPEKLGDLRIHFVGIGGSGMSGIARIMSARGARISGSDLHESTILESLRALEFEIFIGHDAKNIANADLVVRSSAIPDNNPEIEAAKIAGIPVIGRAEALAALLVERRSVAIAGTHGKTTTTTLTAHLLRSGGIDCSAFLGEIGRAHV